MYAALRQFSLVVIVSVCFPFVSHAASIDRMIARSDTGLFSRPNQLALEWISAASLTAVVLFSETDTTFGKTSGAAWDAMAASAVTAEVAKLTFRRQRPRDGNDPTAWFEGRSNRSFPSGEVAHISGIVTPFISTYHREHPIIWSLAAFPVYDAVARMKSQAHWQSDVLAGAALGVGMGIYCQREACPIHLSPMIHGVGLSWTGRF